MALPCVTMYHSRRSLCIGPALRISASNAPGHEGFPGRWATDGRKTQIQDASADEWNEHLGAAGSRYSACSPPCSIYCPSPLLSQQASTTQLSTQPFKSGHAERGVSVTDIGSFKEKKHIPSLTDLEDYLSRFFLFRASSRS
jgi:hypothetical protein